MMSTDGEWVLLKGVYAGAFQKRMLAANSTHRRYST